MFYSTVFGEDAFYLGDSRSPVSRGDCPIVARYEVPGARHAVPGMCKKKEPVPLGTGGFITQWSVCGTSFVHPKLHNEGDRRVVVSHHPVPPGRDPFSDLIPGTTYLATIVLSLREGRFSYHIPGSSCLATFI